MKGDAVGLRPGDSGERDARESRALFRHGGKQIALFSLGDAVHAVDNRCPHEGYPLLQGSIAPGTCLLTCQWHNWKFDPETGDSVPGEDPVRRYPARIKEKHPLRTARQALALVSNR